MRNGKKWFIDDYRIGQKHYFEIKNKILDKRTRFGHIEIFDFAKFGKSLIIDGITQSSVSDEFIYHECLIHPAMLFRQERKKLKILVLGAGEGATLREILKYEDIEKITAIDIDSEAIAIFKKYLPEMHQKCFDHPKVSLLYESAEKFLHRSEECFDIIYSDITDFCFFALGAQNKKAPERFQNLVFKNLKPNGVLAMHTAPLAEMDNDDHYKIYALLKRIFPKVLSYRAFIPFFCEHYGFLLASKNGLLPSPFSLEKKLLEERIKKYNLDLKYLNAEMLQAIFALSPTLKEKENKLLKK